MTLIYKITPAAAWDAAVAVGAFAGAPVDVQDGFIHLSTAAQAAETARRHFAGQSGLVLVAIDQDALGPDLVYEPSRGGDLFPHLFGALPVSAARSVVPIAAGPDGAPVLPLPEAAAGDPASAGWAVRPQEGFIEAVGPLWFRPERAGPAFAFVAQARHLNRNGVVHGGALLTFADDAAGRTSSLVVQGRRQATIQLDMHFVAPAREGDRVEARCRVVRRTRSVNFLAATITAGDQLVATAQGIWKVAEAKPA
jgi:uncharacterized protein (TIGR00369 family)